MVHACRSSGLAGAFRIKGKQVRRHSHGLGALGLVEAVEQSSGVVRNQNNARRLSCLHISRQGACMTMPHTCQNPASWVLRSMSSHLSVAPLGCSFLCQKWHVDPERGQPVGRSSALRQDSEICVPIKKHHHGPQPYTAPVPPSSSSPSTTPNLPVSSCH